MPHDQTPDETSTTPTGATWPPADPTDWREIWPRTSRIWNVRASFGVAAHTADQARERMAWFQDALTSLWTAGYDPHPLVRFVCPATLWNGAPPIEVTLDHEEESESFPYSMMGDTEYYWDWWDPAPDEDDAFAVGERTDMLWGAPDDAAERLRHIEHLARAAATFGRPVDAHTLLRMVTGPIDETGADEGDDDGSHPAAPDPAPPAGLV